jgi:hypothetical protein
MGSILGTLLPGIFEIIGKYFKNDQEKMEAQARITEHILKNEATVIEASRDVVKAEIESESVLARNWRPILMYLLMVLLIWIIAISPIFHLQEATKVSLQSVPDSLWNLLMIGMGGYIFGRSAEKIATNFGTKK